MVDSLHLKNRFFTITQHPIVWFQWNFVWGSSFSKKFGNGKDTTVPQNILLSRVGTLTRYWPPINGQCTNFILFDVALQLPCPLKGYGKRPWPWRCIAMGQIYGFRIKLRPTSSTRVIAWRSRVSASTVESSDFASSCRVVDSTWRRGVNKLPRIDGACIFPPRWRHSDLIGMYHVTAASLSECPTSASSCRMPRRGDKIPWRKVTS